MPNNNLPNVPFSKVDSFASAVAGTAINLGKGERFTIGAFYASGGDVGTLTLERRMPGTTAFRAVEAYTANTEKDGIAAENQEIRLNCTAHTSGTIVGRIGK